MQPTLDDIDHRILALLQEDASLNAAEVANRVGLSQSPCWRRIARLERDGLIESITGIPEGVTVEIRDWDGAFEDETGEWVPAVSEWADPL